MKKMQQYTLGGNTIIEVTEWAASNGLDPNAYPVPGEVGLWKLIGLSNPSRDITGLSVPSVDTTPTITTDENGNQIIVDIPNSVSFLPAYYDYYNLPLRPGVVLI